ncbi:MAG: hypothetical protein HC914_17230, partial [Chloroflexaceae bacterium]|nr:hypothetical protein [Chloroflexaceae bacterium]
GATLTPTVPAEETTTPTATTTGTPNAPELTINVTDGRPGSTFIIEARNFPANASLSVLINGTAMDVALNTDADGTVILVLDTTNADPGVYVVIVRVNSGLAQAIERQVTFTLREDAPLRTSEPIDGAVEVAVPPGLAQDEQRVYLPLVIR